MVWNLRMRNIAGIQRGTAVLKPGVNAVRGGNWQGKSSFIHALEAVMGTETPLTESEDTGRVELETADATYAVELQRQDGAVACDGHPYLADEYNRICADLYGFLDDDNEIRRAVRSGENLEELLTRPLDFENIDEKIAKKKNERQSVETEIDRAQDAANRLPAIQEQITQLESELEDLRNERDALPDQDRSEDETDIRESLSQARAEQTKVEQRIDRLETAIDRTESKLSELREEYDEVEVPNVSVESELKEARAELETVTSDIELLQSVYAANKRILDEDRIELVSDVEHELLDDTITCWLCGNDADEDAFVSQLNELRDQISTLQAKTESYEKRVDELESLRSEAEQARQRKTDLEQRIADLEARLTDRRESLDTAREREQELTDRIDELVDTAEQQDERLAEIESEIKYTERELDEKRDDLETIESQVNELEQLEQTYDNLTEEIEDLRNRKEEMKYRTREAFDTTIDAILTRFDTSFETARLTSNFDLVVARSGQEASLDALSEGELELLGFVAALAGYEAFEVADTVPVLLLDGLGGLTDRNLHRLVEYLQDRAEYLVLTVYPEHATFDEHEIDPDDWQVVSNSSEPKASS